jgi:putative peptide maturation system protein
VTEDSSDLVVQHVPAEALVDAVRLLRKLPRKSAREMDALAQFARFRAAHPEVDADLFIDKQPGHPEIDFDLFLQGDAAGTIAVGWRPDRAMPWSAQYSEHWASNLVVSVNGRDLTVQEALQALRLNGETESDLSTALVNFCLVSSAIANDPPPVSDSELQTASDRFRAARGLYDAEKTDRWLAEAGLSIERFEALVKVRVQARKLMDRITIDQVEPYFAAHIESLAKMTVVRMHLASTEPLEVFPLSETAIGDFVKRAFSDQLGDSDLGIRIVIETAFTEEVLPMLPRDSKPPPVGTLVGPRLHGGEYWFVQVLGHTPARLDQDTRRRIQAKIFALWLDAQRATAQIRWHWM